jgi:hypothetical protein
MQAYLLRLRILRDAYLEENKRAPKSILVHPETAQDILKEVLNNEPLFMYAASKGKLTSVLDMELVESETIMRDTLTLTD